MLIDWFTVIAQIVNFLILVYLLKRFLYKPILQAIEEREQRIAKQLDDAAGQKAAATEERQHYEKLNQDLNQKKAQLLKEAQSSAEAERQRLLEEAKQEYDRLKKGLEESLIAEQQNLDKKLKRNTQAEVFNIARKLLTDLADASLETQLVRVFLQKLKNLDSEKTAQLREQLNSASAITVHSAFELNSEQQETTVKAIHKLADAEKQVQFLISPEEIAGIELMAGGYKISWTIAEYLEDLEQKITDLAKGMPDRPAVPTTTGHGN